MEATKYTLGCSEKFVERSKEDLAGVTPFTITIPYVSSYIQHP